jgi:hypothetical protein
MAMDTALNLVEVLQKLCASEINVSIESDWDGGFAVGIGNQRNGLEASQNFDADKLHLAAEWLELKAWELYPNAAMS